MDIEKLGPYIVLRDAEGLRHACRTIQGIHETADGKVVIALGGNRLALVDADFERILEAVWPHGRRAGSDTR